jgi:eukaryotic-like serine/threonine-protein kinase
VGERSGGPGVDDAAVQQAVETFVDLHGQGRAETPERFASGFPPALQDSIVAQCREYLAFDELVGPDRHAAAAAAATTPATAREFGDFTIEAELGRGGMGIVYLARQRSLNRRVALKVMAGGLSLSQRHVERFRREAAATAQIRHPAIVPVHSLTEVDGSLALAMDYVVGRNLAEILDDLRLANADPERAIEGNLGIAADKGYVAECALLCAQIASALAAAHRSSVVHRDLKPRNLMIDERGQVRLLDFGLAKSLGEGSLSLSGELTGTAHYLSPEQTLAKRVEVDHRADIWALGVILYELLTLHRPFDGKNLQQIVYEICFAEPVPPHRRNPKVPRDLVTICQKALEKDPQKRYPSAEAFEADLLRFLRWEPIHAKPVSALSRCGKWLRRHRTESTIATALLLAATIALAVVWYRGHLDGARAHELLDAAQRSAQARDFVGAIALANQALELRNDEPTRARLEVFHEMGKRAETEAARLCLESRQVAEHDRERAIRLALQADAEHASSATRSAVLDALGHGYVARRLPAASIVVAAAWSRDGAHVVTGGYGGVVQVFGRGREDAPQALAGHDEQAPVLGVAFGSGDRIVTASPDRTLRLWNARTLVVEHTVPLPGAAAALRLDGVGERALAVTYSASTGPYQAQVFDTRDGRAVSPPVPHPNLIVVAALSRCGRFAATSSGRNGAVRLWRADGGDAIAMLDAHGDQASVRAVEFAPDGSRVAVGTSDGNARLYRTSDGALLGTLRHPAAVTSLAFDPTGERLLTGSRDQTARLWRLAPTDGGDGLAAVEVSVLVGHGGPVLHVALDPSGQFALTGTGSPDGALRIFDLGAERASGHEPIRRYEVGAPIERATFDRDGRAVLATAGGKAILWELDEATGIVTLRQPGPVPAIAFTPEHDALVTAGDDERVRAFRESDGKLLWTSERLGNPVQVIAIEPGGERLACGTVDGGVRILRRRDGAVTSTLGARGGPIASLRFVAHDRLLVAGARQAGAADGVVRLLPLTDGAPPAALSLPRTVAAAEVAGDGRSLWTLEHGERRLRRWSVPDLQPLGDVAVEAPPLRGFAIAKDGSTIVAADEHGHVHVLDGEGHARLRITIGERVQVFAVADDGSMFLCTGGGPQAEARLVRTSDGKELLRFRGHRGNVECAAFRRDGSVAATSARDGTTCLWPTDPIAAARRLPLGP